MVNFRKLMSQAQEKRATKLFNAKLTPNSGATDNCELKGDLFKQDRYLIECKSTKSKNGLNLGDVQKTKLQTREARKQNWIMYCEWQGDDPSHVIESCCALETDLLVRLIALEDKEYEMTASELLKSIKNKELKALLIEEINTNQLLSKHKTILRGALS